MSEKKKPVQAKQKAKPKKEQKTDKKPPRKATQATKAKQSVKKKRYGGSYYSCFLTDDMLPPTYIETVDEVNNKLQQQVFNSRHNDVHHHAYPQNFPYHQYVPDYNPHINSPPIPVNITSLPTYATLINTHDKQHQVSPRVSTRVSTRVSPRVSHKRRKYHTI